MEWYGMIWIRLVRFHIELYKATKPTGWILLNTQYISKWPCHIQFLEVRLCWGSSSQFQSFRLLYWFCQPGNAWKYMLPHSILRLLSWSDHVKIWRGKTRWIQTQKCGIHHDKNHHELDGRSPQPGRCSAPNMAHQLILTRDKHPAPSLANMLIRVVTSTYLNKG